MHVVCVGDLMVDVLAHLPGPLAPGSDTPAPVTISGGGAAANVAAWLVCAGVGATFVGRVGDDALGRRAVEELEQAGVRIEVSVDAERPTGTCVVLVDPDGERTMVPSSGANDGLGEVPATLSPQADLLYVSGYALLNPLARPFATQLMRLARDRRLPVAVDAASAAPLASTPGFLDLVGRDVLLFANADEALVLTEFDESAAAAQSLALRCGRAVVKRGAAGAVWSDGSGTWTVPAAPAEVIDGTGAGDAFAAGFLAASLRGEPPGGALKAGAALAARAVGRRGARPPAGRAGRDGPARDPAAGRSSGSGRHVPMDAIQEWTNAQQRVIELVEGIDPGVADTVVPACPGWTVRQLLSHMIGLGADILAGDEPDDHNETWTQKQVDARADHDVAALVEEWRSITAPLQEWMRSNGTRPLGDVTIHEQDLRGALGVEGARDTEALQALRDRMAGALAGAVGAAELPAIRLVAPNWTFVAGDEPVAATIEASEYDLTRALMSRRAADQLRGWTTEGDVEPYLPCFETLGSLPTTALPE